jgi:hypothetical protein
VRLPAKLTAASLMVLPVAVAWPGGLPCPWSWGTGMPAPSGQIPPPRARWENEAPATRAAGRPAPGSGDGSCYAKWGATASVLSGGVPACCWGSGRRRSKGDERRKVILNEFRSLDGVVKLRPALPAARPGGHRGRGRLPAGTAHLRDLRRPLAERLPGAAGDRRAPEHQAEVRGVDDWRKPPLVSSSAAPYAPADA